MKFFVGCFLCTQFARNTGVGIINDRLNLVVRLILRIFNVLLVSRRNGRNRRPTVSSTGPFKANLKHIRRVNLIHLKATQQCTGPGPKRGQLLQVPRLHRGLQKFFATNQKQFISQAFLNGKTSRLHRKTAPLFAGQHQARDGLIDWRLTNKVKVRQSSTNSQTNHQEQFSAF